MKSAKPAKQRATARIIWTNVFPKNIEIGKIIIHVYALKISHAEFPTKGEYFTKEENSIFKEDTALTLFSYLSLRRD